MPIRVVCGSCRHAMRVTDEYAGKQVRCKGCGQPVRVPTREPLVELDDLPPAMPGGSVPAPPPLPATGQTSSPAAKGVAQGIEQAFAKFRGQKQKSTPWLKDRRVQFGIAGAAGLLLLLVLVSLFSGGNASDSTAERGSRRSDNGSASTEKDAPKNNGKEKPNEPRQPAPPPDAGEAAGVLPPPPPPFKHAALVQRASNGSVAERNAAIEQLGRKGTEAKPAARILCDAILDRDTREAALLALEKVHPSLFPHVRTLVVDNNAWNHQQASQGIARMEEEGSAAVPVLVWHLRLAARVDAQHPFHGSMESLIGEDLSSLSMIAPGDKQTVVLLIEHSAFKLPDGKPGATVRQRAIDGLGRIAFEFPENRDAIVLTLIPALMDPDVQKNALAAAAKCSTHSAPLKPVLQKLKLHPDASVRQAADDALAAIEKRVAYVPPMAKVGIVEGRVPHPLFEWAFGIVSGGAPHTTALPNLGKHADAELYVLYTCLCLSRLPDCPDRPQGEVRKMALEKVLPFVQSQPKLRKHIAPVLIADLDDDWTYLLARDGLLLCGLDGVRLLKVAKNPGATKAFAELDEVLRTKWPSARPEEQGLYLLVFGELESLSAETSKLLVVVLGRAYQQGQPRENGRLAAKLFARFGIKDLSHAAELFKLVRGKTLADEETVQALSQACAAVHIRIDSEAAFHGSMVKHTDAPPELKAESADWLWRNYPQARALLDEPMKKAFREALTGTVVEEEAASGKERRHYSIHDRQRMALLLVDEFGPEGRGVAPFLIAWLNRVAQVNDFQYVQHCEKAVLALEKLGPETELAKETLSILLSADMPRRLRPADLKSLRDQCKRILVKWNAVPPPAEEPVAPPPGAVVLFNGGNLDAVWDAFYRQKPAQNPWRVDAARRALVNQQGQYQHGSIFTKKEYRNFTLHVEFRFPDAAKLAQSGGGIAVRCKGLEANQLYPGGIESEVNIHECGDVKALINVNLTGRTNARPDRIVRKAKNWECAEGSWNVMEVTCKADLLTVKLNGEIVNEVQGVPDRPGPIALLDNGGLVEYRNIFLVPLD